MQTELSSGTSYTLERRIAEGGMGVVFRGTSRSQAGQRTVAIKRLLATKGVSPEARQRLTSEARLVFQLTHANICQVLDLGTDGDELYVVMEYVHGLDLGRLLESHRRRGATLALADVLYIGREIARALDYTHRRKADDGSLLGLVHGDVTPRNILLSVEGEVKLSDFGIARLGASLHEQVRGGTPGFMAPEAASATIDHRADLYSLGATLWCALTGRTPGQEIDPTRVAERTDVSPELQALLARMLAVDANARPLSAEAVESALATELARRHPGFTPRSLGALVTDTLDKEPAQAAADDVGPRTVITALGGGAVALRHGEAEARPKTRTYVAPRRHGRRVALVAVAVAVVVAGTLVAWRTVPSSRGPAAARDAALAVVEPPVQDAAVIELVDAAPRFETNTAKPIAKTPRAKPSRPPDAQASPAFLTVTSEPWGAVYVNGKRVAAETPMYRLSVPAGAYQVKVFYPDTGTYSPSRAITLVSGQSASLGFHR